MKERTTGTSSRPAHALREPLMAFDLAREVERLRSEPEWRERDRTSITLLKSETFRLVLTIMRSGAEIGDDEADGPFAVHVLDGSVVVARDGSAATIRPGSIATVEAGASWAVRASDDAAVLLALAWPEERAFV